MNLELADIIPMKLLERKLDMIIDKIALALVVVGALNWGSVGIFEYDLVAALGGGQTGALAKIIYILVAIAGLWCISLLFRNRPDGVE